MTIYLLLKTLHIISATVLFGTGAGSAYYMWLAHLRQHVPTIAITARHVVLADWIFTTTTVIVQPATGLAMVWYLGYSLTQTWLWVSIALYVLAGLCWLPVVWIQIQVKQIAEKAWHDDTPLPPEYYRYMRIWFALGIPAFISMVVVFFLMVFKPF